MGGSIENNPGEERWEDHQVQGRGGDRIGNFYLIAHFTVVCLAIWPLSGSDARVDFALIQTFLVSICKSCCS